MLVTRQGLPREARVWAHVTVLALTNCVAPYLLFAWAMQTTTASVASVYSAFTPIITALIATLALRVETLSRGQALGVAFGVSGVLVVLSPSQLDVGRPDVVGPLACLAATVCYGFSYGYTRRFLHHRDIAGGTLALLNIGVAALLMLLLTPAIAIGPVRLDLWIVLSVILLGVLGTGLAYIWSFNIIRAFGATRASMVANVTPIVGVLLGVLVLHEPLTWQLPLGVALVLVGILLTQKRIRPFGEPDARPLQGPLQGP